MIRVLLFILWIAFFAVVGAALLSMDGYIEGTAFGSRFEIPSSLAGGLFAVFVAVIIAATYIFIRARDLPRRIKANRAVARRERGVAALTRGLEAVAVGDASTAQHHARLASHNLENTALTRLLAAQAAQLAGDHATSGAAFAKMIEAPETEFLGLRGLYAKAVREGDEANARIYAERAYKLRPNARWAFEAVFGLALERGAWGEARSALSIAAKNNQLSAEKSVRGEAALLAADAYAAATSGDDDHALRELEAALKLKPAFAPAAVLAAQLSASRGKKNKAEKILETAFKLSPEPSLAAAHAALFSDDSNELQAQKFDRLAAVNEGALPAKAARARASLLRGDGVSAIDELSPLLKTRATAAYCAMMAEAVGVVHGPNAAQPWLLRAASAPRDPAPGADGVFDLKRDGWARLIHEYIEHGRLAPPPLEGPPPGLPEHEFHLLVPPVSEPVIAPVEEEEPLGETTEQFEEANEPAPGADAATLEDETASAEPEADVEANGVSDEQAEGLLDRDAAAARGIR